MRESVVRRSPRPSDSSTWGVQLAYTVLVGAVILGLVTSPAPPSASGVNHPAPIGTEPLASPQRPHTSNAPGTNVRPPVSTIIPAAPSAAQESPSLLTSPPADPADSGNLQGEIVVAPVVENDWRYGRSGWVRLSEETQIPQPEPNWVQRVPPLIWAAILWIAATWMLVWAA